MSDRAAGAMSTIWVHPDQILPQIAYPRKMRIPGGDLLYIEGIAWTARLMADPENPRNAAEYVYPISGADPEAGDQAIASDVRSESAEQVMTTGSRTVLLHDLEVAMKKTLNANSLHPSIGEQGIMDPPIGVMTVIRFKDGATDIAVPRSREGTSRICHAHRNLGVSAHDTVLRYPSSSKPIKQLIADINTLAERDVKELTAAECAQIRCATTPFILIVGFQGDEPGQIDLEEAIKVKVAQEHLNRKRDWTPSAQSAVLADDCIQAALSGGLLRGTAECQWLLGRLSRDEAAELGLAQYPEDRFTRLIHLFTSRDPNVHQLIRGPIAFVLERDSSRKKVNIRQTMKVPLAIELAVRELRGNPSYPPGAVERITKAMASGALIDGEEQTIWMPSGLSIDELAAAAHDEIIANSRGLASAGPAGIELAVRALYYIAMQDVIRPPRHDEGPDGDRRAIGDMLSDMLQDSHGIATLTHFVRDGRQGRELVLRDEQGEHLPPGDESSRRAPAAIRKMFPRKVGNNGRKGRKGDGNRSNEPAGAADSGTPGAAEGSEVVPKIEPFVAAQRNVDAVIRELEQAMDHLAELHDPDSPIPLVKEQGVYPESARRWRRTLSDMQDQVANWFERGVEYWAAASEPPASTASED